MTSKEKTKEVKIQRVISFPESMAPGILYVSDEFETAAHLCPCGCNQKVITPLGPTDWSFTEKNGRPSLYPSIGNWQFPCKSHYWIEGGIIRWSYEWTEEEIQAGRDAVTEMKRKYFDTPPITQKLPSRSMRLVRWLLRKIRL